MHVTELEKLIIKLLFLLRGLTAEDVAAFRMLNNDTSVSIKKSTYNVLRRLVGKNLVTKLKTIEHDYTVYHLSKKGLDFAKELLNVPYANDGNGLLPIKEDTTFWDVPYHIYCPPRYQLGHYTMTVGCIRQLIPLWEQVRVQTAYYANLPYTVNNKALKVKPDLAIIIDDKYYALEVDMGTESKHQLIDKFKKYKAYCDYCNQNPHAKKVHAILFMVPDNTEVNLERRWLTALEAFYKAFDERLNVEINLIFVPKSELKEAVYFEIHRYRAEQWYKNYAGQLLARDGYLKYFKYQATVDAYKIDVYLNEKERLFMPTYVVLTQKRETNYYWAKYTIRQSQDKLKQSPMEMQQHYGYKYNNILRVFLCVEDKPDLIKNFTKTTLNKLFINKLQTFYELSDKFKKWEMSDNA